MDLCPISEVDVILTRTYGEKSPMESITRTLWLESLYSCMLKMKQLLSIDMDGLAEHKARSRSLTHYSGTHDFID
jgi:hypothetical protein